MTDQAPLVSVVVPAFNAERTLRATVESILGQTVEDIEVIVVDDGSRDGTLDVARGLADPRVSVVAQENQGVSAARNAGVAKARGRYVAFLDSDDLWLPAKLRRQVDFLEAHPGVQAVQCGAVYVDDDLNVVSVRRCAEWDDALLDVLLFKNLPAFPSCVMIARDRLEQRGFDPSLPILEDWDVAIHAARHWDLRSLPDPLTLYRVHPTNRSRDIGIHVDPGHRILERLFSDPSLPGEVRRQRKLVYARFYSMLAAGYLKVGDRRGGVRWVGRALRTHPAAVAQIGSIGLGYVRRSASRRRPETLEPEFVAAIRGLQATSEDARG